MTWISLTREHKFHLCEEILRQVSVARDPRNLAWAKRIIDNYLWFWTADGINGHGGVGRDRLKYSVEFLWHSESFCGLSREECEAGRAPRGAVPRKHRRHEHAVPKKLILDRLLGDPPLTATEVFALLERLCFGVALTKTEDSTLTKRFRASMPQPWNIDDSGADPFARYKHQDVDLFCRLHRPRFPGVPLPASHLPRGARGPSGSARALAPPPRVASQDPPKLPTDRRDPGTRGDRIAFLNEAAAILGEVLKLTMKPKGRDNAPHNRAATFRPNVALGVVATVNELRVHLNSSKLERHRAFQGIADSLAESTLPGPGPGIAVSIRVAPEGKGLKYLEYAWVPKDLAVQDLAKVTALAYWLESIRDRF